MAISSVGVLHGIVSASPSAFISQINSARVSPEMNVLVAQSAGLPYPLFVGNMATNPGVTIETPQVKTILDLTGALTSIVDGSGGNTDLFFKSVTDLGRRVADASTSHIRFRMSQAFWSLGQITAGHNREAVASVRIGTTFDGTNNPLVPAGSLALSGTPTSAEHFVAGPVVINTVQLAGVEDITIDFGRALIEAGGDGELYNTFAACQFYAPTVTIRGYTNAWATYGLNGTALTAMTVYLRKVTTDGRVAAGTSQHIAFTSSAGLISVDESSGGNNDPVMTTIRCTLVSASASAESIAVNTATTIS